MRLLYFAHARSATGCAQEDIPVSAPVTAPALWDILVERHPKLAALRNVSRLARGDDFLPADASISPADEIALIPPVSGG
jgi:molybdopterin converting factor small subunit